MTNTIKKYNTGYTLVSNGVLSDPTLSLKAKGAYAYLCSKEDGYNFYLSKKELKEGKQAFGSAIKELLDSGYIIREQDTSLMINGGNV